MSAPAKKDPKGCVAKTPRVLKARATGNTYGVAFGTHIYAAACGAAPLAEYKCTKPEAVPFYRKQGGKAEDLYDIADEGCALPGEILVADFEKGGWIRVIGGSNERWLQLQGSGLERIEPSSEHSSRDAVVPPGWEILTWQSCKGAVLKMVIAGFEWGADAAVVQDTVQARLLRIGTKRNARPGAILGDAHDVSVAPDGTVTAGNNAVIITRPMIGVSWGEDVFDVAGLLNDAGYAAAAAAAFSVRPAQRELEAEAIEAGQQALAAEIRGWFAPSPPSNVELVRAATREASALRRQWAHELREPRLFRVHEGFVQIPPIGNERDEADAAEAGAAVAIMAAAVAAEEEDLDPVQIWVQVALGSILELAACIPPTTGQPDSMAFERLIARGARTFSSAAPLSLFGAGRTSRLCVDETVSALGSLVESMPELKPAGLEMLLALATVTGSARLIAQALQWLLVGADGTCARRCVPNLCALWQLGSVMHFETLKIVDKNNKRIDGKKDPPTWRFAHLSSCSRPATSLQRNRSHRTVSFEEPLPGGVYWEVKVLTSDFKSLIVGVWLESKKKPVGCMLCDGSPVGAGSEVVVADPLPEPKAGSIFGFIATADDLTVTCDGQAFSRILYRKLLVTGERVAVCVEQGAGTQVQINIGQEPLSYPPAPSSSEVDESGTSATPIIWGRACDPYSKDPYQPFATEPESGREVVDLLLQITERNVGRLGSSVDSGTPVQHTFAKSDQMNTTEDGTVVNNIRENSWARVDCEITVGVSVEFVFEVLDDRENDEGTCYGISTAECTKYDSRGSFVLRGYSGHLYCDGSDKGEKFPKIHPRSRVGFRFDYSEGKLEAWLDDQEPRLLVTDPNQFAGRTFYPTIFNYHGTRTKVKLLSCNSGLRSRALLQDSFVLEVSAPAAALWVGILEQLLAPVREAAARGMEPGCAEVEQASGPIATVMKVLFAAANVSPNIWVEFGAVREQLMQIVDFIVIERRNDPALRQPRDIGIMLISVLGVGALFGGPEQVLKVFLSVRDSEASRLGQTLVAYLLKTRRPMSIANNLILNLSQLAVSDELGCQILLRLTLNAFTGGAEPLADIAIGVLELADAALAEKPAVALGQDAPSFVSELLPVLAQLLASLPRREPAEHLSTYNLLGLLQPTAKALMSFRKAVAAVAGTPPRFVEDILQGLNAFMCGVAGRLMATGETKAFPLDIGDAELRDSAVSSQLPLTLSSASSLIDEIAGPAEPLEEIAPPLPEVVAEITSGTGHGEALVSELHEKSLQRAQPVSPVQRAAFAAAVLCKGPEFWESITSGAPGTLAGSAWQAAQVFTNNKMRPAKHAIAANEGDAAAFEAGIAARLAWLVRSVAWPDESAPMPGALGGRSITAPETSTRSQGAKSQLSVVERMRHLGRMSAVEGHRPPEWHLSLDRAQAQLVDEVASSSGGSGTDSLVDAAAAQRDVAVGRRLGLRLLRYLVHNAAKAEGIELLLPALQVAVEETLGKPFAGIAHSGVSRRRAVLTELAGLLKDMHEHCSGTCLGPMASPTVASLSLAMMCVPLPRQELELLLGHLLGSFPALALNARNDACAQYCCAHAAQLVLRVYVAGRGRGGPVLAALLAQIAASLDLLAAPSSGTPLPSESCTDPLETDWDFGAFGRLCPRKLDMAAVGDTLSTKEADAAKGSMTSETREPAVPAESATGAGTGASTVATATGDAAPDAASTDQESFERGPALSLTLKELRQHRTSGVLPAGVAANLMLRFPQAARDDAIVDPVEVLQSLRTWRGADTIWPDDGKPGACAAALTLLRPVAEMLTAEVPRCVERILGVALSDGHRLPASLAMCLYMKLQMSDEQFAKDAPRLLTQLGRAEQLALSGPSADGCSGSLVYATMLTRQLTSRASAMAGAVLEALGGVSMEGAPTSPALAALSLIGGPTRCAACQMQVLNTSFGRSLVVAADSQHVAVLSLDGAADAKAVQWIRWSDLQAPAREVSVTSGVGRVCLWGEAVVNCLLTAVQQLLARGDGKEQRFGPQLLRALTAVLPSMPRWDAAIVTEVVRELDELAGAGVSDLGSGSIELLEHHCTLLRLALRRETTPLLSLSGDSDHDVVGARVDAEAETEGSGELSTAVRSAEAPSQLSVLNQGMEWRGKYKLKRHTNTWLKAKWHMELRLTFHAGGSLDVVARWPKFPHPGTGQNGRWMINDDGCGVAIEFDLELPGGRREGGRTRDCEVFTWKGRLVQSRNCPHLEGTASGRTSDLKYEWYVVPPDPLAILRNPELDLIGKQDETLPPPFSLLSFNTGFTEQKAEHFSSTLGLPKFNKADGTARDLAVAAVGQLSSYQYISGPREVAKVATQSSEENWGMQDSLDDGDGGGGALGLDQRWCSLEEVFGESGSAATQANEAPTSRSASELASFLRREERQLRHALLMRLLQVMLAHRPDDTAIADSFLEASAREAFFKRAMRLPDSGVVLQRCTKDFAASGEVARSALTVAVEGLLTPFMAGGTSTLTVESDHDYHPNEDWAFRLSIPGASRMKLKFDTHCKMENSKDFLQFFADRDSQGNFSRRLHNEEKLCGQYPTGFPDLHFPTDHVWMKFQSDGSQEFWGFRFTLSAEGGGAGAAAVPFPAALKLLVVIANALSGEDRHGVQLMGSSVLLSVAATQPLSDEATRAAEAMCELLPEPCQWSDLSWCAALSLMSVAERNGRRQLLASLVTLLSVQMGPRPTLSSEVPMPMLLDTVSPRGCGVLLNGRTTLVASTPRSVTALGLPVRMLARAGHALFCVHVEATSADGATLGVGISAAGPEGNAETDKVLSNAVCCDVSSFALPGCELNVEVRCRGAGGDVLQLVVSGQHGSAQCDLLPSWRDAHSLVPVLRAEGFGAALTLQSSPSVSVDSEAAAARLGQLQRTSRLVESCRGGRDVVLPAALVVGAWARREGGDDANITTVQERLRAKCVAVAESEHPHSWGIKTQKLEVPGATALELAFPRLEIAGGYRLRITHDAAGELPAMRLCKDADEGSIKHTLEYGKYLFATLDSVEPDSREKGQQESWLKIPSGWELAPGQAEVVQEVIAKHRWASNAIITASGDAFYTLNHEDGAKAGQMMGKDKLSSRGTDSNMEYRPGPSGTCGRILVRRLRPGLSGGGTMTPLKPEDLAPGECVVVPGSTVYIHGPVPQPRRWETAASGDSNESNSGELPEGADAAPTDAANMSPLLCAGPWVWALSPTHKVTLNLMPDGSVKLASTSLETLTDVDFKEFISIMSELGDDLVQQDASWVEPALFRLANVSGSWDIETRSSLTVKLEGADELGTAELLFSASASPSLEDDQVVLAGDITHTRWGRHTVSFEGRTSLLGKVSSAWKWPATQEPAVELQILGSTSAACVEVLVGSQIARACSKQDASNGANTLMKGAVRKSLALAEGEHAVKVRGNDNTRLGQVWLEVETNQGRKVSWPSSASFGRVAFEHIAPEHCEVLGFTTEVDVGRGNLTLRPLALAQVQPFEMPRLPDGIWEGQLERDDLKRQDIRWQLTSGSRGQFEATQVGSNPTGNSAEGSIHGKFSRTGSVEVFVHGDRMEGRCWIDGHRRVYMTLAKDCTDTEGSNARIVLSSQTRASSPDGGALTLDGPSLVYHAYAKAVTKYSVHTARACWTQQMSSDCLLAELIVRHLGVSSSGMGLVIGVATPKGSGIEPFTAWPGEVLGRWLWRNDGAIAHAAVGEQKSARWAFGVGDTVGFWVSTKYVSLLRNGECVHSMPRHVRGDAEPLGRGGAPVLIVGLACDTVLELCRGIQRPQLCCQFESNARPKAIAASEHQEAAAKAKSSRLTFRQAALTILAACRLMRGVFRGPAAWPSDQQQEEHINIGETVAPPAAQSDADLWIECTFTGSEACLSKGRKPLDELGGENHLRQLIIDYCAAECKPGESTTSPPVIHDLFVNELGPSEAYPFTLARISARIKQGNVEKFRQAHLEHSADGGWKVTEMLGDRSGRVSPCECKRSVAPGMEVSVAAVEDGWIKVVGSGIWSRPLWFPIEEERIGRRFVRKSEFVVADAPCFSRAALTKFGRKAQAQEVSSLELPIRNEPFTVEAYVRVPREESGREMCIAAWDDATGSMTHGLSILDGVVSASSSLKAARKVCDGTWHHIACTFNGRELRLWSDFELAAVEECEPGEVKGDMDRKCDFSVGAYPPGLTKQRGSPGVFRGNLKRLRIWKLAMTPAAMKTYSAISDAEVREEIGVEAASVVFKCIADKTQGVVGSDEIASVLGNAKGTMLERLLSEPGRSISCDDWLTFCREVKATQGEQNLMRFLQACARNLGQMGRPLQVQADCRHPVEVSAELCLSSTAWGWRVEAKPTTLSDSMLEHIKDEGLERFQRQVTVAHALFGRSADEAVLELADRISLQNGSHDDCWAKMLTASAWSQAQPRWMEQAVAHARLEDLEPQVKLQQVLAWSFASGKSLIETLEPPFNSCSEDSKLEQLRLEAEKAGGSAEDFAPLAAALLASRQEEASSPTTSAGSSGLHASVDTMFQEVVGHMLFFRFLVLLELNWDVGRDFLPLIDLAAPADSAYGRLLAQVKPRLMGHLKFSQFQRVLQSTKYEGSTPMIILNRKLALTVREKGRVDWEFRRTLIGQFMTEFRKQSAGPKLFRRPWQSRCTKVQFKGEGGEDAGGLYREALDAIAQEMHSRAVPLLVPCPNAIAEVGDNRDTWLLNPRATAPECVRALEFVGQLLGLALRTGDLLPLQLAPFTWKGVVGDERTRDDIRSIDVFAEKHLAILSGDRHPDENALASMGGLQFAYPDVTGEEVELVEGGRDISVTAENASEFARLLVRNRLTFDRAQLQALRRGLANVVPIQLMRLWNWRDLQERVCGVPEVCLDNLKRHTTYKNCTSSSEHVQYMWSALETFSQKQRRSFLRFVWGRSSLPTVERWERNFTVQLLSGTDDSRLPCSRTCFFTLDLPMYSSAEICNAKLLYCITHCLAIDADGAAARSLNWDEDDED